MAVLPPANRRGSGFVNLSRYLKANEGSKVGSAIQSGLQGNINQFKAGLGTAQQDFSRDVAKGALDTDENRKIQEEVLAKIAGLTNRSQIAGTDENKEDDVINQDDIEKFGFLRAGAYGGPREIGKGTQLLGQSQNLEALGNAVRSQGGRLGLLQNFLGGGQRSYSAGQQKLDSLLLGNQARDLGKIQRSTQGLSGETQNVLGTARGQADLMASKNKAFGDVLTNNLKGQENTITNQINALVDKYNKERNTKYSEWEQSLKDRNISAIDPNLAGRSLFGLIPENYLQKANDATFSNVMNPAEQAKLVALSKLSGRTGSEIQDISGTYKPEEAVVFDPNFKTLLDNAENLYKHDLNNWKVSRERDINQRGDQISEAFVPIQQRITELANRIQTYGSQPNSPYVTDGGMGHDQTELLNLQDQLRKFQQDRGFNDRFK